MASRAIRQSMSISVSHTTDASTPPSLLSAASSLTVESAVTVTDEPLLPTLHEQCKLLMQPLSDLFHWAVNIWEHREYRRLKGPNMDEPQAYLLKKSSLDDYHKRMRGIKIAEIARQQLTVNGVEWLKELREMIEMDENQPIDPIHLCSLIGRIVHAVNVMRSYSCVGWKEQWKSPNRQIATLYKDTCNG